MKFRMKKLEMNQLAEVQGGNPCFYLGVGAVLTVFGGPLFWAAANGAIALTASRMGCF